MPRIVLVGAGSVEFTRNLLGDMLTSPALRTSHIALHDIDPERLATAERMARWTADALGAEPTVSAHLDRREALAGADFVVNHHAFVLRLQHDGVDLLPALRAFIDAGKAPEDDLVRAELYRRLGAYPTESSEHHAEYNPWYIGKRDANGDAVERFHVPIGEYLDRVSHNLEEYAETRRMLDAGEPFEIERSGEYAATIAESMTTGVPARIVVNAMNRGALIPNLDADACVEVPGMVDALGVHPVAMGPLPLHLAAYVRGAVDMQGLTVQAALDQDRAAVGHAVMTDPIVQSHLTLDDAWRLTDAMIEAEAEWLPAWLGGTAADRGGGTVR